MAAITQNLGWVALGLIAALGAAGVTIFGSIGLEKVPSALATTLRAVVMAAMLIAVTLATGQLQALWRGESSVDRRAWLFIVLAALSGAISWLAYFAALRSGLASRVAALDRLSVAFVFVLGVLVLGEQHTWRGWLGLVLLVGGIYLVAADR
ncbi:MAG TPA: EamA family transporter [Roseiflexaceae bacterium]|nr:EamA family transporter [Roseiflexaceae bacterium]